MIRNICSWVLFCCSLSHLDSATPGLLPLNDKKTGLVLFCYESPYKYIKANFSYVKSQDENYQAVFLATVEPCCIVALCPTDRRLLNSFNQPLAVVTAWLELQVMLMMSVLLLRLLTGSHKCGIEFNILKSKEPLPYFISFNKTDFSRKICEKIWVSLTAFMTQLDFPALS